MKTLDWAQAERIVREVRSDPAFDFSHEPTARFIDDLIYRFQCGERSEELFDEIMCLE